MLKPAPKWLAWYLRKVKFVGITLPPFGVFVLPECLASPSLAKHESKHWEQYQRMGALKFYGMYAYYSLRYGYRNNPMEVEAREAETEV